MKKKIRHVCLECRKKYRNSIDLFSNFIYAKCDVCGKECVLFRCEEIGFAELEKWEDTAEIQKVDAYIF